jgi:hypothetical protein
MLAKAKAKAIFTTEDTEDTEDEEDETFREEKINWNIG